MSLNHRIQPTYLPSLCYGKSAADVRRQDEDRRSVLLGANLLVLVIGDR